MERLVDEDQRGLLDGQRAESRTQPSLRTADDGEAGRAATAGPFELAVRWRVVDGTGEQCDPVGAEPVEQRLARRRRAHEVEGGREGAPQVPVDIARQRAADRRAGSGRPPRRDACIRQAVREPVAVGGPTHVLAGDVGVDRWASAYRSAGRRHDEEGGQAERRPAPRASDTRRAGAQPAGNAHRDCFDAFHTSTFATDRPVVPTDAGGIRSRPARDGLVMDSDGTRRTSAGRTVELLPARGVVKDGAPSRFGFPGSGREPDGERRWRARPDVQDQHAARCRRHGMEREGIRTPSTSRPRRSTDRSSWANGPSFPRATVSSARAVPSGSSPR